MRKKKVGRFVLLNFKTSCIAAVIKTVLYWPKDKHTDQWNTVESPEIKPYIYDELIFKTNFQDNSVGERYSLQQMGLKNWTSMCRSYDLKS